MVYKIYNIIICYDEGFTVVVISRKWVTSMKVPSSHRTYKYNKHNIKMTRFLTQRDDFIQNV